MPKPILHQHYVNSPLNPNKMAVQVAHQRADGMFIIGYVEYYDDDRWFAYTIDGYKLLCDPDDGEPVFFRSVIGAGEALVDQHVYHLRPRTAADPR